MRSSLRARTFVGVVACSFVMACSSSDGSSGGGATCTGAGSATFDGTACGGDIVGTWKLVSFGGPPCVTSVASSVGYAADGTYSLGGTWKYGDGNTVVTTVGTGTSSAEYCVQGDYLWTKRSTDCGPGQSTILTVVRKRDCGPTTPPPDAGR